MKFIKINLTSAKSASFFIAIAFFYGCIGGVSSKESALDEYYSQRRKSMDILELLDTLVTHGYYAGEFIKAREIKAIDWEKQDGNDPLYHGYFSLQGTMYITMDGNFTERLPSGKTLPIKWMVFLSGAHVGYTRIIIDYMTMTNDFSGFGPYFKKKGILLKDTYVNCQPDYQGCLVRKMTIKLGNRDITVMEQDAGGGTGGSRFTLFLKQNGADGEDILPTPEQHFPSMKKKVNATVKKPVIKT